MIVHLGGGIRATGDDLPFFRVIVSAIYEHGDNIARNWIELSHHSADIKNEKDDQVDWDETFDQNEDALLRSSAFIAEVSTYRLYHGYEMAMALQQKKPVLLVSRKSFRQFAISGNHNKLLSMKEYSNEEELSAIVKDFLSENTVPSVDREINVPVDLQLHKYLCEMSEKTDKTKGEILRDLAKLGLNHK